MLRIVLVARSGALEIEELEVLCADADIDAAGVAVGETAILQTPPSPSALKNLLKRESGVQQNDSSRRRL